MKLLLLGATGRTGKLITETALQKGYPVNCLVRSPEKLLIDHHNISLFEGSPLDKDLLQKAMIDCDAVVSALNVSRTSDFPWAKLRSPKNLMSDTMKNVIALMNEQQVKRLIVCSAWGAAETKKDIPYWFRWFIDNSNIGAAYQDHERQEAIIKDSTLDWTIVRPVGLTNSKKERQVIVSYDNLPKPKMTISRHGLAQFMIDSLNDESLIGKLPVISH